MGYTISEKKNHMFDWSRLGVFQWDLMQSLWDLRAIGHLIMRYDGFYPLLISFMAVQHPMLFSRRLNVRLTNVHGDNYQGL